MLLLRNKGFLLATIYALATNPAWSKSFFVTAGVITEAGRFNPEYFSRVISFSEALIVPDIICSLLFICYLKKELSLKKIRLNSLFSRFR